MARAKKSDLTMVNEAVVPTSIEKISVDYGREDINNIAKKINEIIDILNGNDKENS